MPYYHIRHITRYRYDAPVHENITEARMQPRTEGQQQCLEFTLEVSPRAHISAYQDYLGNIVHHFDIPKIHVELKLTAEAVVAVNPPSPLPEMLPMAAWQTLDSLANQSELWDYLHPSRYTHPSPLLQQLMDNFGLAQRTTDPLTTLKTLSQMIYQTFAYAPQSTQVDSHINQAITSLQGVCQDFSHIMIAIGRQLGIPCRYVSGYLFHRQEDQNRSAEDATHAWVEAFLPQLGWVGFDPTNNLVTAERHIRVAVGRDYSDVPPTRGIFVGTARETLNVGVRVALADAPPVKDESILPDTPWPQPPLEKSRSQWQQQQQQ